MSTFFNCRQMTGVGTLMIHIISGGMPPISAGLAGMSYIYNKISHMPEQVTELPRPVGLRQAEAESLQLRYGRNTVEIRNRRFLRFIAGIVLEPMFILLAVATSIYFIAGEHSEGFMMVAAIIIVTAISVFQDARSEHALSELQSYTREGVKVIRDGSEKIIPAEDLVPGDVCLLEEGNLVPADATVISGNDFTVNESVVTGESFPVAKEAGSENNTIFQGTVVNTGMCYAIVTAIGGQTQLGRLGKTAAEVSVSRTLLQQQVGKYVRRLAIFGISAFLVIWFINYQRSGEVLQSLLFALVLAMSAIPEEIPVTFTSFMALGAYQLSKWGIISRNPQVIENLGAVDVVCLDKTGTITENRMSVKVIYRSEKGDLLSVAEAADARHLLLYAMFASEREPFDAMEKAILEAALQAGADKLAGDAVQVAEYALGGRPPMMTHIYLHNGNRIAAGKGAIERIVAVCRLEETMKTAVLAAAHAEAANGYRILGVASAACPEGELPASQDDFNWHFEGMLCLYDPPRKSVPGVISQLQTAGISVKLLTGDYSETARNISGQVGIPHTSRTLTGADVMEMSGEQLAVTVQDTSIFARMFPEAKQKVIAALQQKGHIVAMIGDGVNDVPALKHADIGIAMGKKGAEMARVSADLVITDDNLGMLTEAVRQGRKIFVNLKKSIRYIITIHIPIILIAALPLIFGWPVFNIFTPVHVIFLELIMGPTCSLFFEREPVEHNIMENKPRSRKDGILSKSELWTGILQGLAVTFAILALYYIRMRQQLPLEDIRTEVLTTLLFTNIFLTFANRSFTASITETMHYRNNLAIWVVLASVTFVGVILLIPAARDVFGLSPLPWGKLLVCLMVAFVSVAWYEVLKFMKYRGAIQKGD